MVNWETCPAEFAPRVRLPYQDRNGQMEEPPPPLAHPPRDGGQGNQDVQTILLICARITARRGCAQPRSIFD